MASGSVAARWKERRARPVARPLPDSAKQALRVLILGEDWKIVTGIVGDIAKENRMQVFGNGVPDSDRLAGAEKIRLLREIVSGIYARADVPVPEKLMEILT